MDWKRWSIILASTVKVFDSLGSHLKSRYGKDRNCISIRHLYTGIECVLSKHENRITHCVTIDGKQNYNKNVDVSFLFSILQIV